MIEARILVNEYPNIKVDDTYVEDNSIFYTKNILE